MGRKNEGKEVDDKFSAAVRAFLEDDDRSSHHELVIMLQKYCYQVKICDDGSEAKNTYIPMDALKMVCQHVLRLNCISKAAKLQQPTNDVFKAKKKRLIWTEELHKMFAESVAELKELGIKKPTPKIILERMEAKGVKGLTIENVKAHNQKWEKRLKEKAMNLAIPPQRDAAATNIVSSQHPSHIGDPGCRSSSHPFATSSPANSAQAFENSTPISPQIQDSDEVPPFSPANDPEEYYSEDTSKDINALSWELDTLGDNNAFPPNTYGNFANSVDIPSTSRTDQDTWPDIGDIDDTWLDILDTWLD